MFGRGFSVSQFSVAAVADVRFEVGTGLYSMTRWIAGE
jgi:capsid portal protein